MNDKTCSNSDGAEWKLQTPPGVGGTAWKIRLSLSVVEQRWKIKIRPGSRGGGMSKTKTGTPNFILQVLYENAIRIFGGGSTAENAAENFGRRRYSEECLAGCSMVLAATTVQRSMPGDGGIVEIAVQQKMSDGGCAS